MDEINYIRSFISFDHPHLEALYNENKSRNDLQPSIEPEGAALICLFIRACGCKKVLELGTGNGFSAIWLAAVLKEAGGHLWTVDNHVRTNTEAEERIKEAGLSDYISMVFGDVRERVKGLPGEFDLIFLDCGKSVYPEIYESLTSMLKPGGLLIADDTLFSVNPGVRKGLGRYTDEYNKLVFSDKRFYSTIIPVGHGLTIGVKNK